MTQATEVHAIQRKEPTTRGEMSIPAEVAEIVDDLSPMQAKAFEVISMGGTMVSAAIAAGISRKTLYEWMAEGTKFKAAIDLWKRSMAENTRTRLLILGHKATNTIANAISNGDTRAALQVVKGMGLLAPPAVGEPANETKARGQRIEAETAERQVESERRMRSFEQIADPASDEWPTNPEIDDKPEQPDPVSPDGRRTLDDDVTRDDDPRGE